MVILQSYSCKNNPANFFQRCMYKSSSSSSIPRLYRSISDQGPQIPNILYPMRVAAIVFGDGKESRLYPLTKKISEGALPIAANYRLIDSVVSNCINSNINKIYALTQFNSTTLNSHLFRSYSGVGIGKEGIVEVIAAHQTPQDWDWFQGTADAIRRCSSILEEYPVNEFLVLPGHHLYQMDYQKVVESHRRRKADITVVALSSARNADPGYGLLKINRVNRVLEFNIVAEKSQYISVHSSNKSLGTCNYIQKWGTGIYLVNRDIMLKLLHEHFPKANDFQSEVIPGAISRGVKVEAYLFDGYWNDMRSIKAFYQANMECIKKSDLWFNFYDRDFPIYTRPHNLPPTLISDAIVDDSVIGDGCIIKRCRIKHTLIGMRTRIDDGAIIEDSVIMGSDKLEDEMNAAGVGKGAVYIPTGIGKNTQVKKAIIDRNARIGKNVKILNKDNVVEGNRESNGYIIKDGIIVVMHSATIPDGSVL